MVWDPSPSIRALVRRIVSGMEGIEVVVGAPGLQEQLFAESEFPDLVILGTAAGERPDRWIVPGGSDGGLRMVLLTPPGASEGSHGCLQATGVRMSLLPKPATPEGWERLGPQLRTLVADMLAAPGAQEPGVLPALQRPPGGTRTGPYGLMVVGASSGGPAALHALLSSLRGRSWPGIAVVQHIAPGFEEELVRWLVRDLGMDVAVARDGEGLRPRTVRIAPPGVHLRLEDGKTLRLDHRAAPGEEHRPSIDRLFLSVPEHLLPGTVAVLLDGMGRDGVEGLDRIRRGGGMTVVQDPTCCVIGGMPLAALRKGAALHALNPSGIGELVADGGPQEELP